VVALEDRAFRACLAVLDIQKEGDVPIVRARGTFGASRPVQDSVECQAMGVKVTGTQV
jgi:hypothetical protein